MNFNCQVVQVINKNYSSLTGATAALILLKAYNLFEELTARIGGATCETGFKTDNTYYLSQMG